MFGRPFGWLFASSPRPIAAVGFPLQSRARVRVYLSILKQFYVFFARVLYPKFGSYSLSSQRCPGILKYCWRIFWKGLRFTSSCFDCFTMDRHHRYESTKGAEGTFYSDVKDYYMFCQTVLRHDDSAKTEMSHNKRTIGMAILYNTGVCGWACVCQTQRAGHRWLFAAYQWSIRWGGIIYSLIGLWFYAEVCSCFYRSGYRHNNSRFNIRNQFILLHYSWGELPHSYLFVCMQFYFHTCNGCFTARAGRCYGWRFWPGLSHWCDPPG